MSARDLPATLVPVTTRFAVTLKFAGGIYKREAITTSSEQAILMGVIDARIGSPTGSFYGALLSSHAEAV